MSRSTRWTSRIALLALVVTVTAATTLWITDDGPAGGTPPDVTASDDARRNDDIVLVNALQAFDDCQGLLDHFVARGLEQVGPFGLGGGHGFPMMAATEAVAAADAAGGEAGGAAQDTTAVQAPQDAGGVSGTNVQEAGVDEADIVKVDERLLVTATAGGGLLRLVDLTGDAPRPAGSLELPDSFQQELFLSGDRVLAISGATDLRFGPAGSGAAAIAPDFPGMASATSTLTLIDVSDVDEPRVLQTLELDGSHVSARLVDGIARVVMRSGPVGLPFVTPEGSGLRAERDAEEANRRIIQNSTIDNWLPAYVVTDADGRVTDEGRMLDCANVHRPDRPGNGAGLGLTSVLSVDVHGAFAPQGGSAVITSGDTVYATPTSLYIATQDHRFDEPGFGPDSTQTAIHRFSLEDPQSATYTGSGTVDGRLLNQWAMSEHEGHLRVATTSIEDDSSQSSVVILEATGGSLEEVGRVDGLGVTEEIYAVRYMGDRGYVVTFRQIDPLYVIDLSQPRAPEVLGELKIPGFSTYLHPVGERKLLGVGQNATAEGRTTGLQVSLFDVTDASAPERLATLDLGEGHSPVEFDHRAFLYWAPEDLAVLPVQRFAAPESPELVEPAEPGAPSPDAIAPEPSQPFLGAVAIRIDGEELTAVAQLSHDDQGAGPQPIMRSYVVEGQLLTISPRGVGYGPVDDLAARQFAAFE